MILKFKTYRVSKQKLLRKVKPMTVREFSGIINPIIAASRNLPLETVKHKQFLQSNEVVEFLEKIGESLDDHATLLVLATHQMDKKKLRRNFLAMSQPEFVQTINQVIHQNRQMDLMKCGYKRYLRPNEVVQFLNMIGESIVMDSL